MVNISGQATGAFHTSSSLLFSSAAAPTSLTLSLSRLSKQICGVTTVANSNVATFLFTVVWPTVKSVCASRPASQFHIG